jgi:hypothetical protein
MLRNVTKENNVVDKHNFMWYTNSIS